MMMRLLNRIYQNFAKAKKRNKVPEKDNGKDKKELAPELQTNLRLVKETLGSSDDVIIREFVIGIKGPSAFLLYVDGMIDKAFISANIMKSLMVLNPLDDQASAGNYRYMQLINESVLTANDVKETSELQKVLSAALSGDTVLFIDGVNRALIIETKGYETRGVQEPETEAVVRGPREGFSENLRTNTSLLRRKIKNPNLRFESMKIGEQTSTCVTLAYLKGICNPKLVSELKRRLSGINADGGMGSGYIEAFIEDAPFSIFPTVNFTERPDVAAAKMLEGRIAIITEGTPMVMTVPYLFVEAFQSPEDYLSRMYYMTLVRWIRYISFIISVYLPPLYIALITFHQEMVPTPLLISIAAARERVPFPALVEALGMGATFEILREAGVRMPRPLGQAVSIVGALVIGEAAVSAGLVGAPMVIVTALTAITSFIVPSIIDVTTILRVLFTVLAGAAGLYGIMLGTLVTIIHVVSLRSFGTPYMAPIAPLILSDLKDVLVRAPIWVMKTRPRSIVNVNLRRQGEGQKPQPPDNK